MSTYTDVLHKSYKQSVDNLVRSHCGRDFGVALQIDEFSRVLALNMWGKFNVPFNEAYESVNQIYSTDRPFIGMSEAEAQKIMADQALDPTSKIPRFFASIVRDDVRHNRVHSRMFAESYQHIVLLFALIDEAISVEEAAYVNKYFDTLTRYCDREGVIAAYNSFDANDHVTSGKSNTAAMKIERSTATVKSGPKNVEVKPENKVEVKNDTKEEPGKALDDLKALVGLDNVKEEIEGIMNFAKIQQMRKEHGLTGTTMSYHLVFTGNPGTGKTTVARIVSRIYKELGLLTKGHLVEVDRGGLVAGYVGQTATKTTDVLKQALGGVLFIDEAYTLANEEDKGFGQEAIDTILKYMEDHRDNICVIVAGYDNLMERFINSNPGLKSRFTRYIHFDDYKPTELYSIFEQSVVKNEYTMGRGVKTKLNSYLKDMYDNRDENFGNGRTVRTYFEQVITNQANRLATESDVTKEKLQTITVADLGSGIEV